MPKFVNLSSATRFFLRLVEGLYKVALVVMMTHAPFAQLWLKFLYEGAGNDTPMQAFEVTPFLLVIPAAYLIGKRQSCKFATRAVGPTSLVILLLSFLLATASFSELPGRSFWDAGAISASTVAMLYIATTSSTQSFLTTLLIGAQPALVASFWASSRRWPDSISEVDGSWRGIFQNRNTLAPIAGLGVAVAFALILTLIGYAYRRRAETRFVLGGLVAIPTLFFDFFVLWKSRNSTVPVALFLAASSLVIFVLTKWATTRFNAHTRLRTITGIQFAFFAICLLAAILNSSRISNYLGKGGGFSARTDYWVEGLQRVLDQPLLGWGWGAAWLSDKFRVDLPTSVQEMAWSHNLFIEFGLSGGIACGVAFIGWVLWSVHVVNKSSMNARVQPFHMMLPWLAVVYFMMESMNSVSHLIFVTFVGVVAQAELMVDPSTAD